MNSFQESLKELLNYHDMKPYQFSQKLNIPSSNINGYLNNDYYPEIDIAIKMSKFFNCSLDYLFGLDDDKNHKIIEYNNNSFFDNFDKLIKNSPNSIAKTLKELNMSETNYYRWKRGKFPKTINLIEIAKYFNVSLDFLIGDKYK